MLVCEMLKWCVTQSMHSFNHIAYTSETEFVLQQVDYGFVCRQWLEISSDRNFGNLRDFFISSLYITFISTFSR